MTHRNVKDPQRDVTDPQSYEVTHRYIVWRARLSPVRHGAGGLFDILWVWTVHPRLRRRAFPRLVAPWPLTLVTLWPSLRVIAVWGLPTERGLSIVRGLSIKRGLSLKRRLSFVALWGLRVIAVRGLAPERRLSIIRGLSIKRGLSLVTSLPLRLGVEWQEAPGLKVSCAGFVTSEGWVISAVFKPVKFFKVVTAGRHHGSWVVFGERHRSCGLILWRSKKFIL